jgi:hypothetical protein
MRRPVDGEVHVHYGQIYVESDPDECGPGLPEAFFGQSSGLCGAAVPGALWLTTGLHTGCVGFTVEVHEEAPAADPAWEEVVEVSFRPVSETTRLMEWGSEAAWELDLDETDYRVRYCAKGMDQAHGYDTRTEDEPQQDCYLLQFWPAPPAPDRVVKQTAAVAAYWHNYAAELPPPPTPAERAEAERQARLRQEEEQRQRLLAHERWEWGGRLPSDALRHVGGNVSGLLPYDPALLHALDDAGAVTQRAVALLAARRACEAAGLADLDWIAAGLTALSEGRPLPPPLDDRDRAWQTLASDPRVPDRTVGRAVPPERPPSPFDDVPLVVGPARALILSSMPEQSPQEGGALVYETMLSIGAPSPHLRMPQSHLALPALLDATATDPVRAAIDATFAAVVTYGEAYPALLQELRSACRAAP